MSQQLPETWFIRDGRINAGITWLLVVILVVVAIGALLEGLLVRMTVAAVAAVVAVVPAVVRRTWTYTVPWPLLLVCSIPVVSGTLEPTILVEFVTGLSIAALGMLLVVALQLTSSVRMTPGFAVVFVVLATMATVGFWALGSAASARWFGTAFLETNEELMHVFTVAALAGLAAGVVFSLYFRHQLRRNRARAGGEEVWTP